MCQGRPFQLLDLFRSTKIKGPAEAGPWLIVEEWTIRLLAMPVDAPLDAVSGYPATTKDPDRFCLGKQ